MERFRRIATPLGVVLLVVVSAVLVMVLYGWLVRRFGGRVPSDVWANAGVLVFLVVVLFAAALTLFIVGRAAGAEIPAYAFPIPGAAVFVFMMVASLQGPALDLKPPRRLVEQMLGRDFRVAVPPSPEDVALAFRHRPLLWFDTGEPLRPLDVDEFLAEESEPGRPAHRGCLRRTGLSDECSGLRGTDDLYPLIEQARYDSYLDLNDDGWSRGDREGTSQRIYFRVVEDGLFVRVEYWWFFRYNRSPVRSALFCLSGLSLANITCFDHEGDWEGATVALLRGLDEPVNVTYTGHHWPGYRYDWPELRRRGSTRDGHPYVFVAYGSHASYPIACRGRRGKLLGGCDQLDYRVRVLGRERRVADGRHNGEVPWLSNADLVCERVACLAPLPVTVQGTGARWNAYDSYWGRSGCALVPAVCLRVDGPLSPSLQDRFQNPSGGVDGSLEELDRHGGPAG